MTTAVGESDEPLLLRPAEAARLLGVSRAKVYVAAPVMSEISAQTLAARNTGLVSERHLRDPLSNADSSPCTWRCC